MIRTGSLKETTAGGGGREEAATADSCEEDEEDDDEVFVRADPVVNRDKRVVKSAIISSCTATNPYCTNARTTRATAAAKHHNHPSTVKYSSPVKPGVC